jgi:rhodanese-related sulfurtransferase
MPRRRILDTETNDLNPMDFELTAEELKVLQESGEPFAVLDVREPWEYQAARIEGSRHIPMGEIPACAHQELDPEAHIVVVCHHGVRSLNVTHWLRQQGFEQVQSLRGGIDAWSRRIDPTVPLY